MVPRKKKNITCLLISSSPDVPDDFVEVEVGSSFCENKTALHFPATMMQSALWIKICQTTNQEVTQLRK